MKTYSICYCDKASTTSVKEAKSLKEAKSWINSELKGKKVAHPEADPNKDYGIFWYEVWTFFVDENGEAILDEDGTPEGLDTIYQSKYYYE